MVNIEVNHLADSVSFLERIGSNIDGVNIVYFKIMFTTGEFKMAGSQVVWNYKGINSIDNLRGVVHERLIMLLDRYQYSMSSISHIIITFVPSSFELKSKFGIKNSNYNSNSNSKSDLVNTYITSRLYNKNITPLSVNPNDLGFELTKVVSEGQIIDVRNNYTGDNKISLAEQFNIDSKLSNLSTDFKKLFIKLK